MRRIIMSSVLAACVAASAAGEGWVTVAGSGRTTTSDRVAIGAGSTAGTALSAYDHTSLRLGYPTGFSSSPCPASSGTVANCLQLAFGTADAQFWGFRLSPNYDLHLDRQGNSWAEGFVFTRSGTLGIGTTAPAALLHLSNNAVPFRAETANSDGGAVRIYDGGQTYGVQMDLEGLAGTINVASRLQLGLGGLALVRSNETNTPLPLYLNLFSPNSDVIVGNSGYTSMGLRVDSYGVSSFNGSLGIGTKTPSVKLDVVGDANFSGTVTGGNIKAKYQDVAEWVPSTSSLPPATVVVLDREHSNHVMPSSRAYDTSVAGVVSAQPGITLGEPGTAKSLIATTGRVRVRVDASRAPVAIGDLLVTSDKPGVAMKSVPIDVQGMAIHRPATVLGKALEPLGEGEGDILVLLTLQ